MRVMRSCASRSDMLVKKHHIALGEALVLVGAAEMTVEDAQGDAVNQFAISGPTGAERFA